MIKYFFLTKTVLSNTQIRGSFWLFLSSTIVNILNFIYTIFMGKILGPVDYGVLTALVSLLYIVSVPSQTLQTVSAKFVSKFFARKEYNSVWLFFIKSAKYIFLLTILISLFVLPNLSFFSKHLNMPNDYYLLLIFILASLGFINTVGLGLLQGVQLFFELAFTSLISSIFKLLLGIGLVVLGFGVGGALWGLILSGLVVFVASSYYASRFKKGDTTNSLGIKRDVITFTLPTLIVFIGLVLIVNQDVILVKKLFSDLDAGYYSALSTLGKIVFFASSSVAMVFFPLASEKFEKGEKSDHFLNIALLLVGMVGVFGVLFYYFIPEFVINLIYGEKYLAIAPLLWIMGVFNIFYSLIYLMVLNFLSSNRVSLATIPLFGAIVQFVLIWTFHESLREVCLISTIISAVLFIVLFIVYSFRDGKSYIKKTSFLFPNFGGGSMGQKLGT